MSDLLSNPIFLLIVIIIIGEFVGRIKIKEFSLDSAAILFVAMLFGYFGFGLDPVFRSLGLVLFIYSIGLQAGPGFLSSFKQNGLTLTAGAVFLVSIGFLSVMFCAYIFDFNNEISAGLFSGALTSTPGLAVAAELTGGTLASAAYGLTYCFGVIGTVLFIKLLPKLSKIDIEQEEITLNQEIISSRVPVKHIDLEVTNPNIFDKTVEALQLTQIAPITITRLWSNIDQETQLVSSQTILKKGDRIRVVGLENHLESAKLYIGSPTKEQIRFHSSLKTERIIVSKVDMIGHTLGSLDLWSNYNVKVERIIRNGFDLPINSNLRLNMGDVLYVVGNESTLQNVTKLLGNNIEATYTARVTSILFGILIGYLIGKIPLYFPFVGIFNLGTTGGVLIAGLVLSYVKKTGPFVWETPNTANIFIRELGLVLFLATVGSSAGATIVETFQTLGLRLFAAGIIVTTIPLITTFIVGKYILKIRFLRLMGVLTGGMTSTPGLAAASSVSTTQFASTAYATVYPVALVSMILYTKLIVLLL